MTIDYDLLTLIAEFVLAIVLAVVVIIFHKNKEDS